jgi:hypothetical protein
MQDISSQVVECLKHSRQTLERTVEIDSDLEVVLNKALYDLYFVLSSIPQYYYPVAKTESGWTCTCQDHEYRKRECKHIKKVRQIAGYDLPENAYEQLAETKSVSCPVCHSSRAQRFHKCEPGYCYWAEQADEAA